MNMRMAEAVEGAAVVCLVVTRKYKSSANCMKELNYADQRGCDIVPLICDDVTTSRHDLLSGQVGLITAGKIYIDFSKAASSDVVFQDKIRELIRALGDRGKVH
jgi:hypothetical protein